MTEQQTELGFKQYYMQELRHLRCKDGESVDKHFETFTSHMLKGGINDEDLQPSAERAFLETLPVVHHLRIRREYAANKQRHEQVNTWGHETPLQHMYLVAMEIMGTSGADLVNNMQEVEYQGVGDSESQHEARLQEESDPQDTNNTREPRKVSRQLGRTWADVADGDTLCEDEPSNAPMTKEVTDQRERDDESTREDVKAQAENIDNELKDTQQMGTEPVITTVETEDEAHHTTTTGEFTEISELEQLAKDFESDTSNSPAINFQHIPEEYNIYQNIVLLHNGIPIYIYNEKWACNGKQQTNRSTHSDLFQGGHPNEILSALWITHKEIKHVCVNGTIPTYRHGVKRGKQGKQKSHPSGAAAFCQHLLDHTNTPVLLRHCKWKTDDGVEKTQEVRTPDTENDILTWMKERNCLHGHSTIRIRGDSTGLQHVTAEQLANCACNGQLTGPYVLAKEDNTPSILGPIQYSALKLWEIRGALSTISTHCSHQQIRDAFIKEATRFIEACSTTRMKQFQSKLKKELDQTKECTKAKKGKMTIGRLIAHWTPSDSRENYGMDILLLLHHEITKQNDYKKTNMYDIRKDHPMLCFLIMIRLEQMYAEDEIKTASDLWESWTSQQ